MCFISWKRMKWETQVVLRTIRNAYMILLGRPATKKPLGRLWRWWEDNIKMDLEEVE
jgi:hypothetical protein